MVEKNKKAWIKILEALISILLLMGIILTVVSYSVIKTNDKSAIGEKEIEILKSIQINQTLREEILTETTIPISSDEVDFPQQVGDYLNQTIPTSLECLTRICPTNFTCIQENEVEKDIYVKEILILSNKDIYNPRILKIFCNIK